jgi:mycothiol synthase
METTVETFVFTVRPITEADYPALVDFLNECAAQEEAVDSITLEEAMTWYRDPRNNSHETLAFAVNEDGSEGKLIGDVDVGYYEGDHRAWGWMHVHPDYRNRGVGRALYSEFERQVAEKRFTEVMFTPSSKAICLTDFLGRRGFVLERYFWEMQLPAGHPVEPAVLPEGFTVRTFVPDQDEELFTHVRNVTFAEHYGSVQRTLEEMTYLTKEPHFRSEGLFFAFEGDNIAGFCYTGIDPRECERRGETVGHIHTLGVMPEYRGRGIGRALLLTGVNYLRRDVSLVELGVEGKNRNALGLYESVGFKQHKAWANLKKEDGAQGA